MHNNLVPIYGTQAASLGRLIAYPKPTAPVEFTVFAYRKALSPSQQHHLVAAFEAHPSQRSYMEHTKVKELLGADEAAMDQIEAYLKAHDVEITDGSLEERFLLCSTNVKNYEALFHTTVGLYTGINRSQHLDHSGYLYAPSEIAALISNVTGLHKTPTTASRRPTKPQAGEGLKWEDGYGMSALAKAYNFPEDLQGEGQCIGIVELGGRYKKSDFKKFCKLANIDVPLVKIVGDLPATGAEASNSEVTLDMQVVAGLAPEATIVLYYAHTFIEALRLIVNDKENQPSVVSISWAATENYYNETQREEFNTLLAEAALQGITVLAASGDHGAYNRMPQPEVSMPAAHPYVLGVGGTTLVLADDKIESEVVWNEFEGRQVSGGGFSVQYDVPDYQSKDITAIYGSRVGRGVPDVAANASDIHGYQVIFEGDKRVIGGTSASTPLWAVLIALCNQKLGYRIGFANAILYHLAGSQAFNPILQGNNQVYSAGPFWNPCTGLGTPNGQRLLELIEAQADWVATHINASSNENQ